MVHKLEIQRWDRLKCFQSYFPVIVLALLSLPHDSFFLRLVFKNAATLLAIHMCMTILGKKEAISPHERWEITLSSLVKV